MRADTELPWEPATLEGTHVGIEAVGHEFKLSIGRDEGDGAVVLKA